MGRGTPRRAITQSTIEDSLSWIGGGRTNGNDIYRNVFLCLIQFIGNLRCYCLMPGYEWFAPVD